MFRHHVMQILDALGFTLAELLEPEHEGLSALLAETRTCALTHDIFWTLIGRLRHLLDRRHAEARAEGRLLHAAHPSILAIPYMMGANDTLRVDPRALLALYRGPVPTNPPIGLGEMRHEVLSFMQALGFQIEDVWATKGELPHLRNDLLADTQRGRTAIEDLLSDSPANPLTSKTYRALIRRLQLFLSSKVHAARKNRVPLPHAFPGLMRVPFLSKDRLFVDPKKLLGYYKGSFARNWVPVPIQTLYDDAASASPAVNQSASESGNPRGAEGGSTGMGSTVPGIVSPTAPPTKRIGITIPGGDEEIPDRLKGSYHLSEEELREAAERQKRKISRGRVPQNIAEVHEVVDALIDAIRKAGGKPLTVRRGCLDIWVEMTPEQIKMLVQAIAENESLREAGILIRELEPLAKLEPLELLVNSPVQVEPTDPDGREKTRRFIARAIKVERILRHWMTLRALFSRRVRLSPMATAIAASGERSYSAAQGSRDLRKIAEDWLGTLLLWPIFVVLITIAFAGLVQLILTQVAPSVSILPFLTLGIACGLSLATFGAQPCSYVLGVIPCGGGSIATGVVFGLATSLILALPLDTTLSGAAILADPFTAITGGIIGLSAPGLLSAAHQSHIPYPLVPIGLIVLSAWLAIAISAWLMAQPRRASPMFKNLEMSRSSPPLSRSSGSPSIQGWFRKFGAAIVVPASHATGFQRWRLIWWRAFLAAILGSSGIGATLGLTTAMSAAGCSMTVSFTAAFAIVGGCFSAASVVGRTGSLKKAASFLVSHSAFAVILCWVTFHTSSDSLRLAALSATSGVYHSTWFTASYLLGEWLGGAECAESTAVSAATIESLGFIVFVAIRLLSGNHI